MRRANYDGYGRSGPDPKAQPDRQVGKHKAKKDTKRWCLGHEGREHQLQYEPTERWYDRERGWYPTDLLLRCAMCRKVMNPVASGRDGAIWIDPSGNVARFYNQHGFKQLVFYGPGLPPLGRSSDSL